MNLEIPTYYDVLAASDRLAGHVKNTPLLRHDVLDKISGVNLYLKNETVQKSGSFKYRGAYSRLSLLSQNELTRGVVAFSSGNHAQGVALAARELGTTAIIVMPNSAPDKKKQGTLALGAHIVEYDIATQSREKLAANIAKTQNRVLVPAFDDRFVIAGQGGCGLEISEQCAALGISLDALITPMGGGGLCAGISLAIKHRSPNTKIYGAEPIGYDDQYRSLKAGKRLAIGSPEPSICDALMSPMPGRITFAINKDTVSGVLRVTDDECLLTMQLIKELLGVSLEPGGAAALAAVLTRRTSFKKGMYVAAVLSGGNVDKRVADLAKQTCALLSKSSAS